MLQGPDLSKWQGTVDFNKLKTSADFVILRSSYGLQSKDAKFYEYAAAAKKAGIPILGVYHFCYATSAQQAETEALNCMEAVKKAGLDKDTILFYDLEYDSVEKAKAKGVTLNKAACIAYTNAFCRKVKANGYRTGVYFNKDYYRNMYDAATLEQYIRWLAEYNSNPTYDCELQQIRSNHVVSGVNGNVDWNYLWNDGLLFKSSEPVKEEILPMSDNEFYNRFIDAMEEYRLRLRMKEPSPWSEEARKFCVEQGIFRGDGEGNFQWNDFLTREQAAQLIYNAINRKTRE